MGESAKRHKENLNLIKEIRASIDVAIRNQGALIKTLEIQIRQMSKVLQDRGFRSLPSSTEANPRDQVKSISTTIKADLYPIRRIGSSQYAELPLSTYLNLGLGELNHTKLTVELKDRTVKYTKGIAENVLVGIVLENMDTYCDKGIGDVIFGEPFLREVGIKAKRFEGMITLYNGDDEVTYQIVRSHPRFKRHTNEQCNKILPLLKVSEKDEMNGILHAYQKLKGFLLALKYGDIYGITIV
ncbi:hypothetical protein Tco_0814771 [Tanacetum coccineum]